MELELSNGLKHFWQWDTNQSITVPDNVPRIDFRINGDTAVYVAVSNNIAAVPDECFQSGEDLILWAYKADHTIAAARVPVEGRVKPADYVYTPTETKMWHTITDRMTEIEKALEILEVPGKLTSGSWTPAVSGAESYDHQVGTYAVVGSLAVVSFSVKGKFVSEADGELSITGCPVSPEISAAGGGLLSGYYAADNILFTGWMIAPGGTITGQCGWATTKGHKYVSVASQGKGSSFQACGTIAFPIT